MTVLERPQEVRSVRPARDGVGQGFVRSTTLVNSKSAPPLQHVFIDAVIDPEPGRALVVGRIVNVVLAQPVTEEKSNHQLRSPDCGVGIAAVPQDGAPEYTTVLLPQARTSSVAPGV